MFTITNENKSYLILSIQLSSLFIMKRHSHLVHLLLLMCVLLVGACSNSVWDEVPSPITSFIEQYYPGSGVKSFTQNTDGYKVKITNGASLSFDTEYSWTFIDGNGVRLPEVLVYNQLPPALYNYLQGIEQQADVYDMNRDSAFYTLTMHDTVITYDIATGKISYPDGKTIES